jgi:uncharacterized membrane protein (UPF0127 family)
MAERIVVELSGRIIADEVIWAHSFRERSRGLIGRAPLRPGEALVLEPGSQVHTWRMTYPIDVVFCDKTWVVRHVVRAMAPRRMSRLVFGSRYVIELPAGAASEDVRRGTRLRLIAD